MDSNKLLEEVTSFWNPDIDALQKAVLARGVINYILDAAIEAGEKDKNKIENQNGMAAWGAERTLKAIQALKVE